MHLKAVILLGGPQKGKCYTNNINDAEIKKNAENRESLKCLLSTRDVASYQYIYYLTFTIYDFLTP